jgi:hypothetical protein
VTTYARTSGLTSQTTIATDATPTTRGSSTSHTTSARSASKASSACLSRNGCYKTHEHQAHGRIARGAFEIDGFPHSGLQNVKNVKQQRTVFHDLSILIC